MAISTFSNLKIRTKLISVTLFLVLLPLVSVAYLAIDRFGKALREAAEQDLEHLVMNVYAMCEVQHEMLLYEESGEKSGYSLKDKIKRIEVGKTGYVYIMDSQGTLNIHPAKEGENVMGSKDSEGFEYIRSMTERAVTLKEGEVGTIRYPWLNPELGEKRPREKISKYKYFEPWDWIIVAGTYEEEIYQSLYETERFILIVVLVGLCLVFFLTVALSKVLTGLIQELTEVTSRMADGDLSQRVEVRSRDEIGILGDSFNQMITQIQTYTISLEKMVEERTRDLKESREKHRDLSRFLNSILDSATEYAIMALDVHGKIIEYNKGAEKLFGWKKEDPMFSARYSLSLPGSFQPSSFKDFAARGSTTKVLAPIIPDDLILCSSASAPPIPSVETFQPRKTLTVLSEALNPLRT